MASEKRPGGLTALAVVNFVIGGFLVLMGLALMAAPFAVNLAMEQGAGQMPPEQLEQMQALNEIGAPLFYTMAGGRLLAAVLLILSGIGYLQLKRFLGRTLGNVYAVVGVLSTVALAVWVGRDLGGGFNLSAIIGLIYPILTLILLNTTFKEDFVN